MNWVRQTASKARESLNRVFTCCLRQHTQEPEKIAERKTILGLLQSREKRRVAFACSLYKLAEKSGDKTYQLLNEYLITEICDLADIMELSEFPQQEKNEELMTIIEAIHSRKKIYQDFNTLNNQNLSLQAKKQAILHICRNGVSQGAQNYISSIVQLFLSAGADSEAIIQQIQKKQTLQVTVRRVPYQPH